MDAPPLLEVVRSGIQRGGPMTFAAFMQLALYHPKHGFYAGPGRGPGFDFRTSPSLTPAFGTLLTRAFTSMWKALGEIEGFTVVEVGPGGGELAQSVWESAEPEFRSALRWEFVERFPALREVQAKRLEGTGLRVAWRDSPADGTAIVGCVFANEVVDNFPVHVFQIDEGSAREVYVALDEDHLVEALGPSSSEAAGILAAEAARHLEEGDRFEVCTAMEGWCRETATALESGYLLVIDYGDTEPQIWTRRPGGSVVTYKDERLGDQPLEAPGDADITFHVNFTHLANAAGRAGFRGVRLATQRRFLERLGVSEIASDLASLQKEAEAEGQHAEAMHLLAERGRLGALGGRGGLGDLLVLLGSKGAPEDPFKLEDLHPGVARD
ncbi:MAG: class I SAM-dependent methyltransferase [Actinomycetota bacterium]